MTRNELAAQANMVAGVLAVTSDKHRYDIVLRMLEETYDAAAAATRKADCKAVCEYCRAGDVPCAVVPLRTVGNAYSVTWMHDNERCAAASIRELMQEDGDDV